MVQRHDVVACARGFVGVRFAHQGRSKSGLDCLGLLLATAEAAGLKFDGEPASTLDVPTYGLRPDTKLLQAKLEHFLIRIPPAQLLPADIVLLNIASAPQHLALISDYPNGTAQGMIHAYALARKVVEHRYDPHWQRATHACYRLPIFFSAAS